MIETQSDEQTLLNIRNLIKQNMNNKSNNGFVDYCKSLLELIKHLGEQYRLSYIVHLIDLYTHKVQDMKVSYGLLAALSKQTDQQIQIQYLLRISYNSFKEAKYNQANIYLTNLNDKINKFKKNKTIKLDTIRNYSKRFINHSYSNTPSLWNNVLKGIIQWGEQKYQYAFNTLLKQYYKINQSSIDFHKYHSNSQVIYFIYMTLDKIGWQYGQFNSQSQKDQFIKKSQKSMKQIERKNKNIQKIYNQLIKYMQLMLTLSRIKYQNNTFNHVFYQILALLKLRKVISSTKNKQQLLILQQTQTSINIPLTNDRQIEQKTLLFKKFIINQLSIIINATTICINYRSNPNYLLMAGWNILKKNVRLKSNQDTSNFFFSKLKNISKQPQQNVNQIDIQSYVKQSKFTGSDMIKIHQTSDGSQKRYFYIIRRQIAKGKYRLYYAKNKQLVTSDDNYYSLKTIRRIQQGKTSKQLKRQSSYKYQSEKCFSLFMEDQTRSFYVLLQEDYINWVKLFKKFTNSDFVDAVLKSTLSKTKIKMF